MCCSCVSILIIRICPSRIISISINCLFPFHRNHRWDSLHLSLFLWHFIHTSFTCIYCENQTNLSDSLVFYQIFLYFLCYTYTYKLGFPRNRSSKKIKQQQKSTWVIFRDPSSPFATVNFWTSEFKCGQTIYMVPHNGNCVKLQKPWVISYERLIHILHFTRCI